MILPFVFLDIGPQAAQAHNPTSQAIE